MKKSILVVIVTILLLFTGVNAYNEYQSILNMPLIFDGGYYYDTPTPTLRPTFTPEPTRESTPIPTIPPQLMPDPNYPYNWQYLGSVLEGDGFVKIAMEVASFCHESYGRKEDKVIYVWNEYIGDIDCKEKVDTINEECRLPGCRQQVFPLPECTGDDNQDFNLFPCVCPSYELSKGNLFCGEPEIFNFFPTKTRS